MAGASEVAQTSIFDEPSTTSAPNNQDAKVKRRNRPILSCTHCRIKKLKCNRNKPCSSCVKLNNEQGCTYSRHDDDSKGMNNQLQELKAKLKMIEANWQSVIAHSDENRVDTVRHVPLDTSKEGHLIGINPVCSTSDIFNYRDVTNFGDSISDYLPLFPAPLRLDPGLNLFWKLRKNAECKKYTLKALIESRTRNGKALLGNSIFLLQDDPLKLVEFRAAIASYGLKIRNPTSDIYNDAETIINSIKQLLPGKMILVMLIERFFVNLYPYFPIVDEYTFKDFFNQAFVFSNAGFLESIQIKNRDDLAHLVTLLIVFRFSYVSVFHAVLEKNEIILTSEFSLQDDTELKKSIMTFPITIEIIDICDKCLKQFEPLKRNTFAIFQAFLMRRVYSIHAPEEDYANLDNVQVSNGFLIQLAIANYLHRDPELYFFERAFSPRECALRRKMWYFLIRLDRMGILSANYHIAIHDNDYDTKLPFVNTDNSNILNLDLEHQVCNSFTYFNPLFKSLYELVNKMSEEQNANMNAIMALVTNLEHQVVALLGQTSDYIQSKSVDFMKTLKFQIYLNYKQFFLFLYGKFQAYYENCGGTGILFFLLRKLAAIMNSELAPLNHHLVENCDLYFDDSFSIVTCPSITYLSYICSISTISLSMRLRATQQSLQLNPELHSNEKVKNYLETVGNIIQMNRKFLEQKISLVNMIGQRYFFAWAGLKACNFGYHAVHEVQLEDADAIAVTNSALKIPTHQFRELESIFLQCLELEGNRKPVDSRWIPVVMDDLYTDYYPSVIENDNFWIYMSKRQLDPNEISPLFTPEIEDVNNTNLGQLWAPSDLINQYNDIFGVY